MSSAVTPPVDVGQWRRHAAQVLRATSDSPALDADLLLCHVLGVQRVDLLTHPERAIAAEHRAELDALLARRARHEPMAYLLGYREFHGIALAVSPSVLVPRPETEGLVDAVLERADHAPRVVLDLGTGSGAVALALAMQRGDWRLVATDRDERALAVAWENALRTEAVQLRFVQADWATAFADDCADVIASNPPYIARGETTDAAVAYEPAHALYSGDDGLDAIRAILADAPRVLRAGGWLCLEHGAAQGEAVRALLRGVGFGSVATARDLAGHERITSGRKP